MLLGPWLLAAAAAVAAGGGAACPVLCSCRGQAVDCSGQRLFSVPPELPLDTGNLSLAHNRIASIPPGYLACYGQLRALDLRNNSLAALPAGLFLGAPRLAQLDLSYNNFSLVPADMFREARGLQRLDLSHNPGLRRVHPQAFRGLAQLRELDLSYGGLSALSLDALEGLPGLVGLRLGGNPWVCGCAMEPFLKWLRGRIQRCASGLPPHPDAGRLSLHRLRRLRRLHRLGGHQLPAGHHRQLLPPLEQGQRGRGRLGTAATADVPPPRTPQLGRLTVPCPRPLPLPPCRGGPRGTGRAVAGETGEWSLFLLPPNKELLSQRAPSRIAPPQHHELWTPPFPPPRAGGGSGTGFCGGPVGAAAAEQPPACQRDPQKRRVPWGTPATLPGENHGNPHVQPKSSAGGGPRILPTLSSLPKKLGGPSPGPSADTQLGTAAPVRGTRGHLRLAGDTRTAPGPPCLAVAELPAPPGHVPVPTCPFQILTQVWDQTGL
ncbi:leucine-rich repeat-containing protein 55 isoform X1 [Caloenas nicobarica]|uniref:leucine-rich repeat-containing protein 55 isoform X1 n=1 Tax=Caloenas nicobarica TaxID=187106 RepID=UPI0032B8602A